MPSTVPPTWRPNSSNDRGTAVTRLRCTVLTSTSGATPRYPTPDSPLPGFRSPSRTVKHHPGPTPKGLGPVRARLVLGRDLVEIAHARDLHVRPERQRLEPVLRLTSPSAPDAETESDEELGDLHPSGARRYVVARF